MVAYTSPDCLPYFEETDAPCLNTGTVCDPSTVWCDFAEAVEAKLTAYDELVQRTAESVPMAWVETTESTTFTVSTPLLPTFTTVRNDTDDMVNFDTLANGFRINTSGLYVLWGYIYGLFGSANVGSTTPGFTLSVLPAASPATLFTFDAESASLTANLIATAHAQIVTPLGAGQVVSMGISSGGLVTNQVVFSKIAMGAAWVGDLP